MVYMHLTPPRRWPEERKKGQVTSIDACLLHEAVLQRSKNPQTGALALADELHTPII
jgi:hypothetical protein